jgi:hypothetical protein
MKRILIICIVLAFIVGCNEEQKTDVIPLSQRIVQPPQDWKDAYGDGWDAQVAFNLAVLRNNDMVIAGTMNVLHPRDVNDPNNLKARIDALEKNTVKDGDEIEVREENVENLDYDESSSFFQMSHILKYYIYKVGPNDPNGETK